mgnify:CR=1 FL=1
MNKSEMIAAIAEKTGMSKKDAEKALVAFIGEITAALKAGDKVQLVGFGSFEVKERAARKGRNPRPRRKSKFPPPRPLFSRPEKRLRMLSKSKIVIMFAASKLMLGGGFFKPPALPICRDRDII